MLDRDIIEKERARIKGEQQSAIARLERAGAKQLLVKTRDEIWGSGAIEITVGTIDLQAKTWSQVRDGEKQDPVKWSTVRTWSYAYTLKAKDRALKKGDVDPETLTFGVDPQRFRGWAGVSLVMCYPDITNSDIPSGMYGVNYDRVGPNWYLERESLTVSSHQTSYGDPKLGDWDLYEVHSKNTTSVAVEAQGHNVNEDIARYVDLDSTRRIAGGHDVRTEERDPEIDRRLRIGFRMNTIIRGLGIETNAFSPEDGVFLYDGFVEKRMEMVARACNNPYYTETVDDSRFTRELFEARLVTQRPKPDVPYLPDLPLRHLLDIRFLSIDS